MKIVKILTVLIILISVSLAQFTSGTKNISGTISYMKQYSEYEYMPDRSYLTISPSGGYFLLNNLAITASINRVSYNWALGNDSETVTKGSYGIGAKYFINNFYTGTSYMFEKWTNGPKPVSQLVEVVEPISQLLIEAGYLFGLNEYVYLDFGMDYVKGLGDTSKPSTITIGIGVATFFK